MTGACLNAPKSPAVPVPIRAEGEAAVFAIRQTTLPEMINVAICNARFIAFSWRPSRPWRWSFSCCTTADLGHLPTWPEGSDANPEHEDNK
jgi:hypothetical protein